MKNFQSKKTKIVATIGPATQDKKILATLIESGLNIIRMNFSHGTHDDHKKTFTLAHSAMKLAKKPIAILQDLSGPKIRIGEVENDSITLIEGERVILTTKKCLGTAQKLFVNYKKLPKEVKHGGVIKIEDGKKELRVEKIQGEEITCKVIFGGTLSSRKGVNLPGTTLSISSLTAKDKKDVLFGIENEVDFIALSFVQTAGDVRDLRKILDKHNSKAHIIAKIETEAAVDNIDDIIAVSDGIMVARGDMAVEVGAERVPLIQKMIIEKCNVVGKPVITATQMLDSMEKSPVPTRAEVSDIANAILDGTDAIMLSGETTIGKYPIESVRVMNKIAEHTEPLYKNTNLEYLEDSQDILNTMSLSVVRIANSIRARLIITLTESGLTPRMIARFKPHHGIIAITPHKKTFNQLQLLFGCHPVHADIRGNIKDLSKKVIKLVKKNNWANSGDKIVVSAGALSSKAGSTNAIFILEAE